MVAIARVREAAAAEAVEADGIDINERVDETAALQGVQSRTKHLL